MTPTLSRLLLVGVLVACGRREPAADRSGADSATPAATDSAPAPTSAASPEASPEAAPGASPPAPSESGSGPLASPADSALAVLRGYYSALNARDYARAYRAWGDDGPPGKPSVAVFAAGYAATDSIVLVPGQPGRVEGAAGSRYVSIPVTLHAFAHDGHHMQYSGSYTLRRTVVPGANAASRRWHLYHGTLHARSTQ